LSCERRCSSALDADSFLTGHNPHECPPTHLASTEWQHEKTCLPALESMAIIPSTLILTTGEQMEDHSKQSAGGKKRAENLTAERRREIASKASKKRWEVVADLPRADYRGDITIGEYRIPCAVLEDGTRVISERGVRGVLGTSGGNSFARKKESAEGGADLPVFLSQKQLIPHFNSVFEAEPFEIIKYNSGNSTMQGFKADILPKICDVWLKAREAGDLQKNQLGVAAKAELLMRGLAHIGIIALVDEATGYQYDRDKKALQAILENFIAKELQPWTKTFPDEFYENLFRLRGWTYKPLSTSRPGVVAYYTVNLVYERLAPGVLEELRNKTPKSARLHQSLTHEIGHPKLKEHISNVMVLQRVCDDWETFMKMIDKALPKFADGKQMRLFTGPVPTSAELIEA